jgi:hypothetical protein
MKIGVSLKIDVTKLDKSRFFRGEKGTYLDVTAFIDLDSEDQYGNAGFLTQSMSQEERQAGYQMPIIGNSKIFFRENNNQNMQQAPQRQAPQQQQPRQYQQAPQQQQPPQQAPQSQYQPQNNDFDEDIGF